MVLAVVQRNFLTLVNLAENTCSKWTTFRQQGVTQNRHIRFLLPALWIYIQHTSFGTLSLSRSLAKTTVDLHLCRFTKPREPILSYSRINFSPSIEKKINLAYLLCRRGEPTFPTDTGLLYSRHRTSASCASILHNSSMNCMSWTRMLPALK